jgi:hypothetical protein
VWRHKISMYSKKKPNQRLKIMKKIHQDNQIRSVSGDALSWIG